MKKLPKNTPGHRKISTARAIGYVRVSTDEQKISPEAQREAIQRWGLVNKINVLAIYEDIGVSGSTPIEERPGMVRALNHLDAERCDWLVTATHDRIARDMLQAVMLEVALKRRKAQLVTVLEDPDPEVALSPEAKMNRRILQTFAEYERAVIRRRTRNALAQLKLAGKHLGAPGYAQTATGRAAARRCFELQAKGYGLRRIVETLEFEEIPTLNKRGWYPCTVRNILARGLEAYDEPMTRAEHYEAKKVFKEKKT
jgi:DNA invertase Pin-like site-specific DNA recombinase